MTFRLHTLLDGFSTIVRYLSLALLPALISEGGQSTMTHRGPIARLQEPEGKGVPKVPDSRPYLVVMAPPSLRFRPAPRPPQFDLEPAAAGPAELDTLSDFMSQGTQQPQASSGPETALLPAGDTTRPLPAQKPKEEDGPADSIPPAILPDDLRREVRPEDLVPFFQFPRGGPTMGSGAAVPPQPALPPTQPPSSATYRLQ